MITENISTLRIHKLSQEQYDRENEAGTLEDNAIYITPSEAVPAAILTGGTGSAYTATVPNIKSLEVGVSFVMIPHTSSTSVSATLNVNGLGAKRFRRRMNNSIVVTSITQQIWAQANKPMRVIYDGTYWIVEGLNQTYASDLNGTVPIAKGGTGASTAADALVNLGAMSSTNPTGTGSLSLNRRADTTIGVYSVSIGNNAAAEGYASFATNNGYAYGDSSFASGVGTQASGQTSYAGGHWTTALDYQHAQGHYNNTTTSTAGTKNGTTGTAFVIGNGSSLTSLSNAFRVTYAGQPYALSSINTSGCDYAEFFEWQDKNLDNEDRRGYFVTLDGEQIRIAKANDYILGVVSGQPAIIGNGDEDWRGRYVLDEFGAFITEEFEYEEEIPEVIQEEIVDEETGETTTATKTVVKTVTKTGTKYKENPDYDSSLDYIQREDRPEWDTVGMLGVLSVRDDGTCEVNGYCKVSEGGIATASETGYRVIKRVNENIVKIIFR